ncbi:TNF receptor-associated factor 4-like isoform X2 [Oculina patagonica]
MSILARDHDQFFVSSSSSNEEEFEEENQPHFGGYDYEFVDEVLDSQKCPLCLLPMRDAVQTSECGHRFCNDCLQRTLRSDHPVCPIDRRQIPAEGGFFSDKAWARDILSLCVKCKQSKRGCDWIGQLRHAEDHRDECSYEEREVCLACEDNIQRRLLEAHRNDECPKRIIECVHCQDEFYFIQKQQHEDIFCRRFPIVCANNDSCENQIPREEMEWHLSEKCPMTKDKRAYLNEHKDASIHHHLEMTMLVATKRELDSISSMKDQRQEFHQMQDDMANLSLAMKNLEMQNIRQNYYYYYYYHYYH